MKRMMQRGNSSIELACLLPILISLLLLVVGTVGALKTYLTVFDASREGARLYVQNGDQSEVVQLVQALTEHLPVRELTTTVTADTEAQKVTVEVTYDYYFFGEDHYDDPDDPFGLELVASTTMPIL